ncbi:MAG: zinc-binding dehydrogenase [Symploca sp. SIO3E6]|nr:zinc-binding dehydrogenase [Caldora sp. SIO3E6]
MQKRKALILKSPREMCFQEETIKELEPNQVLIRSVLSAFKHGTEMEAYHGSSPFLKRSLDHEMRIFLDNTEDVSSILYPGTLGNMTVGTVEKIGSEVDSFAVGDTVFGWLPVADWHVSSADKIFPLDGLTPEQALCIDPANFAIGGVLDGEICFREKVLVTGLGAIGLLAVQYCKLHGATVYASSSFPQRRELASKYGADVVLNRKELKDLGLEVKQRTNGGVDAVIECSGRYIQLKHAMRAARQCGRVVCVGFYSGGATDLNLGEEFFHNRLTLLASLPDAYWNNPVRGGETPRYAKELHQFIIDDFKAGRLNIEGLLGPAYPFSQAMEAVEAISENPVDVIKVTIKY